MAIVVQSIGPGIAFDALERVAAGLLLCLTALAKWEPDLIFVAHWLTETLGQEKSLIGSQSHS